MLNVTVYPLLPHDADQSDKDNPTGTFYDNIDFVSLVNNETYGPPALVAPSRDGARAGVGERVLYINTSLVPLFEIERVQDR